MSSNASNEYTQTQLIEIYALNQQATVGDCDTQRPTRITDILAKAKWDAWNSKMGMSKTEARKQLEDI
ncbi:hypothetical protein BG011_009862 [Mortierella polycephala]|uniref:ACB domain-containing protein n=1 Tax=Mortierella polycephala TaxID=41804 RepID=A0A9P6PKL9_9FUNG|nr:hypothetical protein BG011_009862 [Mortierella polycephala]